MNAWWWGWRAELSNLIGLCIVLWAIPHDALEWWRFPIVGAGAWFIFYAGRVVERRECHSGRDGT